jgi:hypothetical protein
LGKITLENRIRLCIDNNLWSWIRKTKEEENHYIDGSILELFSHRLPDLTLKKLGEKMCLKYSKDSSANGRYVLICSAAEIIEFIAGLWNIDWTKSHQDAGRIAIRFVSSNHPFDVFYEFLVYSIWK